MYQILLDSSNKLLCVALAKKGQVLDSIVYEAWQRQSEMMVKEIDTIMKRNCVSNEEIDAIVVGIGPGSYTGVRIALTIAKTMAYALKVKLYKTSSLSLFRVEDKPTICITNARSGRSYFAVYKNNKAIEEDQVLENEKVEEYVNSHPEYIVSGEVSHLGLESAKFDMPKALADSLVEDNVVKDIFKLKPVYLKELYE